MTQPGISPGGSSPSCGNNFRRRHFHPQRDTGHAEPSKTGPIACWGDGSLVSVGAFRWAREALAPAVQYDSLVGGSNVKLLMIGVLFLSPGWLAGQSYAPGPTDTPPTESDKVEAHVSRVIGPL